MPIISAEQKQSIVKHWLDLTLTTYPEQSVHFILRERDRFRNPLGHALCEGLPALFDAILGGMTPARVDEILEPIVRIRAVQDFSASEAVGFVFLLTQAMRREFPDGWKDQQVLEDRIDQMALLAFNVFMRCREKIYEVQVGEAKRRLALLGRMYSTTEGGDFI